MKKLAILFCVVGAVGCAKLGDEKKDDPKPTSAESKTVTSRTAELKLEVEVVKGSLPSIKKETSCFRLGRLNDMSQRFLDDVEAVITSETEYDQIYIPAQSLKNETALLSAHCVRSLVSESMIQKYNAIMMNNLDRLAASIDAMTALGKNGTIKELKPVTSAAVQTDIQAGKYPQSWAVEAGQLAVWANYLSTRLTEISSGQSCFEMSSYAESAHHLAAVVNAYQEPASVSLLATLLDGSIKGLTEYCKGVNDSQKPFAAVLPELKRSLRESSEQGAKLADLIKN